MAFDLKQAREAGYSDAEIADYLGKEKKFDVGGARNSGYSDSELVDHLITIPTEPTFTEKVKTSFGNMADTVKQLGVSAAIGSVKRADNTEQFGKDAAIATTKSAIGVPEAIVGVADLASGGRAGKAVEDAGVRFKDTRQILDEGKSDRQKQADAAFQNADGFVDSAVAAIQNPSVIANAAIESAGQMGLGGVVGRGLTYMAPKLAPVIAGATGEGVVGASSQAESTRQSTDDGLLTNKQAVAAGASGLGTAFFGVGGGKVAQKFGLGDVDTILAGGAVNKSNKTLARKMVEGGVAEGVFEELPQSVQEQMLSNWSLDKPIMEGVDQAAALGMLTGGAMGAGVQLAPQQQIAEQKAERLKSLPNENLQRLRSTAERAMPADVPLIDAEIERRANTSTLTRAAEEGARVQDKLIIGNEDTANADDAMAAQLQAEYDAQPSEAIPASDILGDENVSDAIAPTGVATEAAIPELDNTEGSGGDIYEVPRGGGEYAAQLDSAAALERGNDGDLDVRDAGGQPDVALDQDWQEFPAETQTLGVPRDEMPQIKAEHRGAMVNFLNARDISHEQDTVPASSLKPTQKEFSLSKVEQAKNFEGGNRSILVSSDNHILDGHHQWLSKLEQDEPIDVIRLNAPITELIGKIGEFPSATTEATTKPKNRVSKSTGTLLAKLKKTGGITLDDKLDVTGEGKGFAPGGYNSVFNKQSSQSLRGLIESGTLDDYLPENMRLSSMTQDSGAYDSTDAYDYLSERIRNGEKVLPYAHVQEIESNPLYQDDNVTSQSDIDEIAFELLEGEINEQLKIASNQEREAETEARVFESGGETINAGSGSGTSATDDRGIGSELQPEAVIETPVADLPKQEREGVKAHVESIVKRRAAANQIGKLKQFGSYLDLAKSFMNGENVAPNKFKLAAVTFKNDQPLADAFIQLEKLATAPAKEVMAEKANAVDAYKQKVTEAVDAETLRAIAKQIQNDATISDAKAQELDDLVMDAIDALETDGPKTAEKDTEIAEEPSKQAIPDTGPKTDLLGDDTKAKQAIADAQREKDTKRNTGVSDTEGFTLTGSNSEADKAAAMGAQDLFSQPDTKKADSLKDTSDVGGEMFANRRLKGISKNEIVNANNDTERMQLAVKSKLWEKPDYQALVDSGVQPVIAHVVKQMYDTLSTKPAHKGDKYLYAYVDTVEAARDAVNELLASKDLMDGMIVSIGVQASKRSFVMSNNKTREIAEFAKLAEKFKGKDPLNFVLDKVFPENERGARWGRQNSEGNDKANATGGRFYRSLQVDLSSFIAAMKAVEDGFPSKREKWQMSYRIENKDGKFGLIKKGRYSPLSTHDTEDQAIEAARALVQREKDAEFQEPETLVEDVMRNGKLIRTGNVSSQELKETIGLKAVNFGNWMSKSTNANERQKHVNAAFDAFHDLASILNLPVKAMSLNGQVGLAIGAQGTGRYAAHFVPGFNEINLTRSKGAGSLAHEWAHAVDHYFGVQSGLAVEDEPFASWLSRHHSSKLKNPEIRPEIAEAFKTIYDTMKSKVEDVESAKRSAAQAFESAKKRLDDYISKDFRLGDGYGSIKNAVKGDAAAEQALSEILNGKAGNIVTVGKSKRRVPNVLYENVNTIANKLGWDYSQALDFNSAAGAFDYTNELVSKEPQLKTIHTNFYRNASVLDGGKTKNYWSTPHELFARAFEMYVADKLAEGNLENKYLVSAWKLAESADVTDPVLKTVIEQADKRYPRGDERTKINEAFDTLFNEIRTKETDEGVALFSRGDASSKGLPVREVQSIVKKLTSKWENAPQILVIESMQDPSVNQSTRDLDAQLKEQGSINDPIAFYSDGKVYILAPQVSNAADVQEAVFHEILGHHGLRKVFGKELANILNELAILRPRDIAKKAKQYGFDTKDKKQVRQAAEEVLAEMAQTNPQIGFVKRAIAAIRKFLRGIGINLKLTDNDIIANYILPARNYVIRSSKQDGSGNLSPAFSKTDSFEKQVDNAINGQSKDALNLGKTPQALVSVGMPDVPLLIPQRVVDKIFYDHGIPVRLIKSLPELLANPVMVFKSDTQQDSYVVMTTAFAQSKPLLVTIKPNGEIENIQRVNIVTSAYSKPVSTITGWIEKGLLLGADKKKALAWTSTLGLKLPLRNDNPTITPAFSTGRGHSVLEKLDSAIRKSAELNIRPSDDVVNPPPDDPAFSRTDYADNQWEAPEESKMDNIIRALQNKHIDLKRVTENIKKAGNDIEDRWNAYLQEELYHGRSAKRIEDFLKHDLEPLIDDMRERGVDMADFEEYLQMRHAEERNKQIAKVNPEMKDGGSGVKTEEARAYLSGLSAHDKENYQSLAKRIDAMTHKSRQVLIDYGLESAGTIAKWEGAYKNYVPLMREDMDQAGKGTGTGFKVKGNASRRATGSNRAVVDIIANIAEQYERNIIRGEKNRVATALIGLATLNPNDGFWKVDTPPTITDVSKATGLVVTRTDPAYKNRPNVVVARIVNNKGEVVERSITFEESDERAMSMAKAINNLDQDQLLFGLGILSKFTRYFASINTQYNPIFGVKNIIRDTGGALLNLSTTPIAKHKAAVFANTPKAWWGIYTDMRTQRKEGHAKDTDWSKLFEEFQSEGGQTGFRNMFSNAQERSEALRNALDPTWWKDSKIGKVISVGGAIAAPEQWMYDKAIKPIFDWLSDYNTSLENAVRLSVYKVALDNGHSKQQAASMAKNISVNFNRKGQAATNIGALYAFFNASVQGSARIGETLLDRSNDGRLNLSSAGKKIVYGGMLMGAMQALLLAAAGFDEDEPPDFIKDRNLIIPDPTGSRKYISIPMPLGYNAIPAFGRIVTEWALSGGEDTPERIIHMMDMLLDVTNPIGNAGLSAQTITPTFADPIAALDANKDFSGKPIYREDFNSLNPTPGFTRSKDKAWDFSVAIARGINYMTGGNDYKQGAISPTADQLEYLAGQFTGGVGREIIKTGTTANALTTGEDLPLYKVPLVGTFVGDTQGQSSQGAKFYDNVRKLNEYQAQLKGMRKNGESTAEFKADNPEAKLYHQGDLALNQVSKLRKRQRILKERGADKEKISSIDERITTIMSNLNEKMENAKAKQAN